MTREERLLLAAVSRHLRERFPLYAGGRYEVDDLTRAWFDEDEITVERRDYPGQPWPMWGTPYRFRTVTEGVDLAVALGLLPAEFSSAYRAGQAAARSHATAVVDLFDVAGQGDGYLYLDCGACEVHAGTVEDGMALADLVADAAKHHAERHAGEVAQ